jgi:hypothetical protein
MDEMLCIATGGQGMGMEMGGRRGMGEMGAFILSLSPAQRRAGRQTVQELSDMEQTRFGSKLHWLRAL